MILNQPSALTEMLLKDFPDHQGLFFTQDGIIADKNNNPLLPIEITITQLGLSIDKAHKHENYITALIKVDLTEQQLTNNGYTIHNVKHFLLLLNPPQQSMVLKAYHWLNWDAQSQFCGKCGQPLKIKWDVIEKNCTHCNISFFPKISPAVMVLIYRDNEILMARSHHFPPGVYATIAGFIEMGESAEETAHREVMEELGIEIENLEYFGTQSWPFPDSFMIAFKAKYLRGEIKIDDKEIEDARWFNINDMPKLPMSASVARKLLESAISDLRKTK